MNIAIIGAGPVGCYSGYLLAKQGHKVTIYENHSQVGSPIQCTGLLTTDFDQFNLPKDSFLVNTMDTIEVRSNNHSFRLSQREYLVCRTKFDQFFANLAIQAGAKIFVNHSFIRKEGKNLIIKDSKENKEITIAPNIVIAADGPLSPTAKAYGLYHPERENYFGVQATVEGNFEPGTILTHFSNDICPGLFAWVVSESTTRARVGLGTKKNSRAYFDRFMAKHNYKALDIQAGTIPLYHPKQQLQKNNCYLVGDAAGFVKATTLGGLIPGLKQAQVLAHCIETKEDYQKACAPIAKRLKMHLTIRKALDRFNDVDFDRLVKYVRQKRIKSILTQHTRENPLPIVAKAAILEPRFAYFAKYLF